MHPPADSQKCQNLQTPPKLPTQQTQKTVISADSRKYPHRQMTKQLAVILGRLGVILELLGVILKLPNVILGLPCVNLELWGVILMLLNLQITAQE